MESSDTLRLLLADLPNRSRRGYGDAFEFVADYALLNSVDFGHEIKTIERFKTWARRTGVGAKDLGVDAVATTHDGRLWALQSKGYSETNRVSLPDMNNFIVEAKAMQETPGIIIDRLILITSGPGLNQNAAESNRRSDSRVVVLNRQWMNKAAESYPTSYKELRAALTDPSSVPKPFILRQDQNTAVQKITSGLRVSPEVQYHAACGTGKTVISEAIASALGAKLIIFFVPSIGLLRQTIQSIRRQTGAGGMHAIAVCSDDSVASASDDRMEYSDEDIPCEVIRTPEEIAHFIQKHTTSFSTKPVYVFSTYQSAHLVIEAQHSHGTQEFDLAFCDEAHYLVGTTRGGEGLGELVKRKNDGRKRLIAQYRVYATATPRLLSAKARGRLKAMGGKQMDSMDATSEVFGPIAYKLTFGEAITLGALCDYELSIVAVEESKYADFINNRAYVENGAGTIIDAQTFAAMIALEHAAKQGDERVIVYTNRVAEAQQFARMVDENPNLPGSAAIWGKLPASQREDRVNRVNRPGGYVLTNVRCLNEGVDIPNLDAVLFAAPKSSPIDIAQSTGRVLRVAPGKIRGNIIVPVAVPAGDWASGVLNDDEKEAVMTGPSPYKAVFEVLMALAGHDETIQHVLTALRLGLKARANKPGVDHDELPDTPEELREYIDSIVGPDGSVEKANRSPLYEDGTSVLAGGKVVLYAAGMTDEMREQFAASMRLMIVRESSTSNFSDEDRILNIMVYGWGYTWPQAIEALAASHEKAVKQVAAA